MLDEPYTGLYGLFFIEADTHTWKNGLYFNKLTLNLKAVMDEKETGELLGEDDPQKQSNKMSEVTLKLTDSYVRDFRVDRLE